MATRRPAWRRFFVAFSILAVALLSAGALAYGYRDQIKSFVGHDQRQQVKALGETTWNAMVALRPIEDQRRVGADDGAPNILFVLLDTCRADKLGSYGFERETTPALDELARDPNAVTFLNHYVQASWTKPSVASMFTGLFPSDHGVVTGVLKTTDSASERRYRTQVLSPEVTTIAEVLGNAGYYTFAVLSPHHLGAEYGFDQGFAEYHGITSWPGGDRQRLNTATALIEAIDGKFFGFVHLLGCHAPFEPRHRSPDYMASYGFAYDEAARREAGVDFTDVAIGRLVNSGERELTDDDVRFLHLRYEAKLRWVDEELISPLIQMLKDTGPYDETLILITADHGEELYEHGGLAHGHALWNELIHVPLIAKFPKGQRPEELGPRVTGLTRGVDLYPSLVAFAGLPLPQRVRGVPALQGIFARQALAEQARNCAPEGVETCQFERALITDGFKLIVPSDEDPLLLFDMANDSAERRSLAGELPQRVASMTGHITELVEADVIKVTAPAVDTNLSEEKLRELRGLGYIQ
jgi:arylsulfatase A-like enzyme